MIPQIQSWCTPEIFINPRKAPTRFVFEAGLTAVRLFNAIAFNDVSRSLAEVVTVGILLSAADVSHQINRAILEDGTIDLELFSNDNLPTPTVDASISGVALTSAMMFSTSSRALPENTGLIGIGLISAP